MKDCGLDKPGAVSVEHGLSSMNLGSVGSTMMITMATGIMNHMKLFLITKCEGSSGAKLSKQGTSATMIVSNISSIVTTRRESAGKRTGLSSMTGLTELTLMMMKKKASGERLTGSSKVWKSVPGWKHRRHWRKL